MIDLNSPADGFEFAGASVRLLREMAMITDKAIWLRASLKQGSIAIWAPPGLRNKLPIRSVLIRTMTPNYRGVFAMSRYDQADDGTRLPNDLADRAVDLGLRATDAIGKAVSQVEDTANQLMEQGSEASANVQKVAGNFGRALDRSLNEEPMTTLGLAVAMGFVLGALWKA